MSSTHVVVDHTAFPFLIDHIFEYAPRASLLVMRGVSRKWRRRSDDMLAGHLIVLVDDYRDIVSRMTSPHGRLPSLKRWQASNINPDQLQPRTLMAVEEIAKRARILEVLPSIGCYFLALYVVGTKKSKKRVIKVRPPQNDEFVFEFEDDTINVPTVVTFTHVKQRYVLGNGECSTFSVSHHYSAGKRFVLNIYVPGHPFVPRHQVQGIYAFPHNSETLEQVILIFSTHAPTTFRDSRRSPTTLKPLHIIATAFRATVSKTAKFTLVGVETVNRRWLGFPDDLADGDLVPAVAAEVRGLVFEARATRKLDWSDDEVNEIANAVEILTHDEYKARVGEEQYVFETVEGGEEQ